MVFRALVLLAAGCTPSTVSPTDLTSTGTPTPSIPTPVVDPGADLSGNLLAALGDSVWHGSVERDGVVRTVEQHFRASIGEWSEVVSPEGPAWDRRLRSFSVETDGVTVQAEVIVPSGWQPDAEAGIPRSFRMEVVPGTPRVLRIESDGRVDAYTEGPAPRRSGGFRATARVFAPGGEVDGAFCDSGVFGFDYDVLFDFARGQGEAPRAVDTVSGVPLEEWVDFGDNDFAVANVPGFNWDGGTALSDRFNFVVSYAGVIQHPGGPLRLREADDTVEDGLWVFVGGAAGTGAIDDVALEVHGFFWFEETDDEVSLDLPAGELPIEVIAARCTEPIAPVTLEFAFGDGPWQTADWLPTLTQPPAFPAPF